MNRGKKDKYVRVEKEKWRRVGMNRKWERR